MQKTQVHDYWNRQSCDTQYARASKFSREYFEQIENFRYYDQPFVHSFAQFSRYRGKRVLEVGFGAGTDFIQWLRAGARATGIDLTEEALANLRARIGAYDLPAPECLLTGDAEHLPLPDDGFDLGYSFGVLHHTPDTRRAMAELARVVRPGGEIKVMLYNRHSVYIFNRWIKVALLRGQPWRGLRWTLWNHVENPGTKGYTRRELRDLVAGLPLEFVEIHTVVTSADYLAGGWMRPLRWMNRLCLRLAGTAYGWHPAQYVTGEDQAAGTTRPSQSRERDPRSDPSRVRFTGNPLGFFHCIAARKKSR